MPFYLASLDWFIDTDSDLQKCFYPTQQLYLDRVEGHRSWLADHYASTSEAELAKAGDAILGGKSAAKSDRDTVTRVKCLSSLSKGVT